MKIKLIKNNTYYIDTGMSYIPFYKIDERRVIFLDSGWAQERQDIENLLADHDLIIAGIICSHSHIDHIGNNAYYKEKYNSVLAMPAYEALICSSPINLKLYYNNQTLSEISRRLKDMICEADIMILQHQDNISICGVTFKIIHTPGHSPAHICIITPDDVAYLGDCLISYKIMKGAKMPYAFILKEDLKSKEKLYNLSCTNYVVAHKGVYEDITDLITDNINFYKTRAEEVLRVIKGTMTMEDILKAVIKSFHIHVNSKKKYVFIERMLKSYVEYLYETDRIELNIDNDFLKYSRV